MKRSVFTKRIAQKTRWIKRTVQESGFTEILIALSGGIDSAVSLLLASRAVGKEHVHVLLLPYGVMSKQGMSDALLVANHVGLSKKHIHTIDIKEQVDTIIHALHDDSINKVRRGNIMARVRMIFLYDFAKKIPALVCGTENKTEQLLGYFTRFGDEASDLEPIRDLYKTQVREMADTLGIPEKIITKAPTAGLWEGQTDEGEFGFTYDQADRVLFYALEEHLPESAIIALGIEKKVVEKVLQLMKDNAFKHRLPHVF